MGSTDTIPVSTGYAIGEMEVDVIGPEAGKLCGKAVLTGTDTLAGSVANM
eukprot:COSAG02_NODE_12037_length_1609_cov_1.372848_2_plen_50_part_00